MCGNILACAQSRGTNIWVVLHAENSENYYVSLFAQHKVVILRTCCVWLIPSQKACQCTQGVFPMHLNAPCSSQFSIQTLCQRLGRSYACMCVCVRGCPCASQRAGTSGASVHSIHRMHIRLLQVKYARDFVHLSMHCSSRQPPFFVCYKAVTTKKSGNAHTHMRPAYNLHKRL